MLRRVNRRVSGSPKCGNSAASRNAIMSVIAPAGVQRDHVDRVRQPLAVDQLVGAEGQLAVGARRHEAPRDRQRPAREELPDRPRARGTTRRSAASRTSRPRRASRPPRRGRRGPTRRRSAPPRRGSPRRPAPQVACWERSGSRSSTEARARCIALLTDAGVVSSISATSLAEKPRTSRRISTARWLAGRCCSAAMNASSTLSRAS